MLFISLEHYDVVKYSYNFLRNDGECIVELKGSYIFSDNLEQGVDLQLLPRRTCNSRARVRRLTKFKGTNYVRCGIQGPSS